MHLCASFVSVSRENKVIDSGMADVVVVANELRSWAPNDVSTIIGLPNRALGNERSLFRLQGAARRLLLDLLWACVGLASLSATLPL